MNIRSWEGRPQDIEADALVVVGFEEQPPGVAESVAENRVGELYSSGEFSGKALEIAILHHPAGLKAKRLVLAGGGKAQKFSSAEMRKLAGAALRHLKEKGARRIALALDGSYAGDDFGSAAVEGAILGDFEPHQLKTDPKKNDKQIEEFVIAGGPDGAAERGRIIGEAQNFARSLSNEPPNLLTPLAMADRARRMAAGEGLECEVLEQDRMRQLGMGALLGVAQGSAEPPALIVLRYKPQQGSVSRDHLALVGKGVTFDTGGISIKPADGMEKMKYDMSGGAAAIGAMRAIARLKPAIPVTALIPTVENMPGSRAQRPGDIVTSLSGKTIEVLNTDAEGRLILADALTYAQRLNCTHLIDAATLTGAIVIALGEVRSGVFGNNEQFTGKALKAAAAEGEKMWELPMDDEYREHLKTPFADIQNIGGRPAGSITAAWFLKDFVGETPWVHLDIAGTAWLDDAKPWMAKGPTGVAVRTFTHLAVNW